MFCRQFKHNEWNNHKQIHYANHLTPLICLFAENINSALLFDSLGEAKTIYLKLDEYNQGWAQLLARINKSLDVNGFFPKEEILKSLNKTFQMKIHLLVW